MSGNASEVKKQFEQEGISIADWARARGFSVVMVYRVLSGKVKGRRGEAHRIAVELGLKKRPNSPRFSKNVAA